MNRVLLLCAFVLAVILMLLGAGFFVQKGDDPHLFGWLGAVLAFYLGSLLVPDGLRRRPE